MKPMINYKRDDFLTKILKKKSYEFFILNNKIPIINDCQFAFIKTGIKSQENKKLTNLGFYLVTIMSNLELKKLKIPVFSKFSSNVKLASLKDKNDVKKLAYNSFKYDRFHNDHNIKKTLASKINSEWVENYFIGKREHKCFVYKENDRCVGFLSTLSDKKAVIIDLIAVDNNYRNKGIGKKLIDHMLNFYKHDLIKVSVGTQFNNKASLNLYKNFNFSFKNYSLVWHWHSLIK